jgi:predicted MFS family arabinose efflux permease
MTAPVSASAFSTPYRAWLLTLLVAAYASSFIDRIVISIVGQAVIAELHLTDLQFGLLGGMAFAIFYSAFGLPVARLAERRSRTAILSVSVALWSLMTTLCGVAQNYATLLLYRMGVGVGEAGCTPASHSLISDHYPAGRRSSALGIYFLGVPLGTLLGALAGGWIGEALGWRAAMIAVGAPGLLLAALIRLTLREPPRGHVDGLAVAPDTPPLAAVVHRVLRVRSLRHLVLGVTITTLAANGIGTFAPAYFVRGFGLRLTEVGVYFGLVMGAAGLLGLLAGGFGADRTGRRDARWYAWLPGLGVLVAGPFYALAYSRSDIGTALPLLFVGASCLSAYSGPAFAVAQNLVGPRMRASVAAILLLLMNLVGQGFGPALMGTASDALAARAFGHGDYRALCIGASADATLRTACAAASATGLRQTLVGVSIFLPLGALHFAFAARTLREDLEQAERHG